jgi:hypothetical protein
MVWDTNSPNQEGTKGTMTIVDRKNLSVFGVHAMEGINEVYPKPSAGIEAKAHDKGIDASIYNLQGIRIDDGTLRKGIYISQGKKMMMHR